MVTKLGILGSGVGSNMAAIATACRTGALEAEPVLVLSDVDQAPILKEAATLGIPNQFIAPGPFQSKLSESAEREVIDTLRDSGADWIILAGYMRIIKSEFLRAFPERILNIHPSLLPSFPGLNAAAQALEYGVRVTGCTVHLVDQGIDTGAIIAQEPVRVEDDDTVETLTERIKGTEHRLYPKAISDLISGRVRISGRRALRS